MRSEGRNLIQPLDLLFYQVFKKEWSDSKSLLQKPLPRGGVIKSRFPTVYKDAWEKTYNAKALVDSFKRSGLCPWNTSSPQYSKVVQPGKPDLASNCARLAPNGTNLGLLKISFLYILARLASLCNFIYHRVVRNQNVVDVCQIGRKYAKCGTWAVGVNTGSNCA